MPFITSALLRRLVDHAPHATAVAPRREGRWEGLFSRFSSARALPVVQRRLAEGALSMQGLLDELAAEPLPLLPDEEKLLSDWDRPEDVT
jgi:molybdopterin-guanine dinucleotide biosynthesis protein A